MKKNKERSTSSSAKAGRKKATSLKTLKPKRPTSEQLRQVLGGLGSRRADSK